MAERAGDGERVPSWLATSTAWTWRILLLAVGAAVVVQAATRLSLVTVPLIVALILSTLAAPPARGLVRAGAPRGLAAFLVVFGGLAALLGGLAALVPTLLTQTRALVPTVLEAVDGLLLWLEDGPLNFEQQQLRELGDQALAQAEARAGELATGALSAAATVLQLITALILTVILLFFLVKDGDRIWAWFLARASNDTRDTVLACGIRAWEALAGYVRGTALVALIDAVGIGIGLAVVGVPLVLPLAVLVFFGGFVPIVGAFVSGLIAVLVALADGGITAALIVFAIVVVVQQVESDVLQPVIMRRAVALHPIVVLAVLTAGSMLVGVVGAFLAVPLAAVASAVSNELRLRHETATTGPAPLGGPRGMLVAEAGGEPDAAVDRGSGAEPEVGEDPRGSAP